MTDSGQVLVADTLSHSGSAPTSHLHALDGGTGRRRWKADLHAPEQGFFAEPPVVAGSLAYVASASRMLVAVDTRSGREVWRDQDGFPLVAGVRAGLVLALVGDRLVALDRRTGREIWSSARLRGATAPVVAPDRVVTATRDGSLVGFAR